MAVLTLTNGSTGTTYGTFADANSYLGGMLGDQYAAWFDLADDDARMQSLIAATRRLNRLSWSDNAATFAVRDAIVAADPDDDPPFRAACYELAALAADDSSVLTTSDQGTNIEQVDAAGVGVTYFNPTSPRQGTAPRLPPILMDLIGTYLVSSASDGPDGGDGGSGDGSNPFDHRHGDGRWTPF